MIGGQPAAVAFSGLAPGFAGLYQVNATVPPGLSAGTSRLLSRSAGPHLPPLTFPCSNVRRSYFKRPARLDSAHFSNPNPMLGTAGFAMATGSAPPDSAGCEDFILIGRMIARDGGIVLLRAMASSCHLSQLCASRENHKSGRLAVNQLNLCRGDTVPPRGFRPVECTVCVAEQ